MSFGKFSYFLPILCLLLILLETRNMLVTLKNVGAQWYEKNVHIKCDNDVMMKVLNLGRRSI